MQWTVREYIVLLNKCVCTENVFVRKNKEMHVWVYSQSFLLCDVKGGCHVDEGGKAVQVVTVGMRKDGVCLNKRERWVEEKAKINTFSITTAPSWQLIEIYFFFCAVTNKHKHWSYLGCWVSVGKTIFISRFPKYAMCQKYCFILPCVEVLPRGWWLWQRADHHCWSPLQQDPTVTNVWREGRTWFNRSKTCKTAVHKCDENVCYQIEKQKSQEFSPKW